MTIFRFLVWLILLSMAAGAARGQQSEFSQLIVFGDSLSDTGNLAVVNLPPPYYRNRISDGPVIADLIAAAIGSNADRSGHLLGGGDGFNYAVAGGDIDGTDREDLTQQVSAYLSRVDNTADPNALYLMFVGGNDLRGIRSITSAGQASIEISNTLDMLLTQLSRLRGAGARAFFIPNVANIGRIPETLGRELTDPGISARAETYTRDYNQRLVQSLAPLSNSDRNLSIQVFDLFQSFENLIDNASDFGFTNTQEGCFDPNDFEIELECLLFGFGRRVFFDNIHPSSASNSIVGQQMILALPRLPADDRLEPVIAPILQLLLFE